jgi:hypothetical protein
MLEGRGGPTGTAVLLQLQRAPPFPRGPQSRRWGGFLAGNCHPAHVLASSRGSLSVLRDFRPGLSIPHFQRVRSDQAPWPQLSSRSAGVHRHACVACMGPACLTSYSHVVHREPGSGGRAPVCPKVVRACSQPQGMFLHFETRRSGVGECARPVAVRSRPKPRGDSVPKCRT